MRQNKILHFIFLLSILFPINLEAGELVVGRVTKVSDGDTISILSNGAVLRIRLSGIDAPEKNQPFGMVSRDKLSERILGQDVSVAFEKRDRYGRVLGKVLFKGEDINLRQVKDGLAWWYRFYKKSQSPTDQIAYSNAEKFARDQRVGLWESEKPINPYEWRSGRRQLPQNIKTGPSDRSVKFDCGVKKHCAQMSNCKEAMNYLSYCGRTNLDRDGDGIPCESICQ